MIRIDAIWLATEPMDMRAGTDTALARVVAVFGAAQPHCAYLFANRRANRMKVLVHDGLGTRSSVSARMSARNSTTRRVCSPSSVISEASGSAISARP